jgi:hypothetical protein
VDAESGLGVFGDGEPDFQISFTESLTYKRWELNVLMHWKQGGDNINLTTLLSDIFGTHLITIKNHWIPQARFQMGHIA